MDKLIAERNATEIISLLIDKGSANYSGEAITQVEHACQAAKLAEVDSDDDEIVLAALLHDFGHMLSHENQMDGYGTKNHEDIGAKFLKTKGFSDKIVTLVKSHVEAKRYLCFANKHYYDNLSHASKITLQFQGGPMSEEEAKVFGANPLKNLIIKMRMWDEEAKHPNIPLPDLEFYKTKIITHLTR